MKATAAAPTRSTATTVLSLGLVAIPVGLYTSTESTRVARKEFTADGHEVGRQQFDKETGMPVKDGVVKMATATDGTMVELTDAEVEAATSPFGDEAKIEATVPVLDLHTDYVTEKLYQIRPKVEKKGSASAEKAFSLLMAGLAQRDEAAIVRIPMRGGVARVAAVTGDGYLRVLQFTDGVREARPMPTGTFSEAELNLMDTLLDSVGDELPNTEDTSAAEIQKYVDAKAAGTVSEAPSPAPVAAPAEDLAGLLAASLAAVKVA
jgi:non-homologous end joining protein Ku